MDELHLQCTATCGSHGKQTRTATCVDERENRSARDEECTTPREALERECHHVRCAPSLAYKSSFLHAAVALSRVALRALAGVFTLVRRWYASATRVVSGGGQRTNTAKRVLLVGEAPCARAMQYTSVRAIKKMTN